MATKKKNLSAGAKAFADMTAEEQAIYVANLEKIAAGKKPEDIDTSFEADGQLYDFNKKSFSLEGNVIDVAQLVKEGDTEKFDEVCAKLVHMESGFITKK